MLQWLQHMVIILNLVSVKLWMGFYRITGVPSVSEGLMHCGQSEVNCYGRML